MAYSFALPSQSPHYGAAGRRSSGKPSSAPAYANNRLLCAYQHVNVTAHSSDSPGKFPVMGCRAHGEVPWGAFVGIAITDVELTTTVIDARDQLTPGVGLLYRPRR
jgi:hypothetical protein